MPTTISGTSITTAAITSTSIDLTTPLSVADGGTGISSARGIAQIVTFQTGAVATGTTIIPFDNTIPQNTEGTQFMSLPITPINASSTLEITVNTQAAHSDLSGIATALFQDSNANAIAAMTQLNSVAGGSASANFTYLMSAGTTSITTFKVRIGAGGAGTLTFNGSGGAGILGGVMASRITIKEYLP